MTDKKLITTPVRVQDPDAMRTELAVPQRNPAEMMQMALEHKADPAVLQKLIDIQQQWEAAQARKAYVEAMTAFKSECPAVLGKDASVDFTSSKGRTHYKHATLGSIVSAITPMLSKNGLSISWETAQESNAVRVTCNITHRAGHRESTTLCGPRDESGNKNLIQAVGSAVTYLQRYTLLSALGLATADQDDDGGKRREPIKPTVELEPENQDDKGEVVAVTIGEVKSRSGGSKEKPWVRYYFKSGDEWFSTFSNSLAEVLRGLVGQEVELRIERNEKGNTVLGVMSDAQE